MPLGGMAQRQQQVMLTCPWVRSRNAVADSNQRDAGVSCCASWRVAWSAVSCRCVGPHGGAAATAGESTIIESARSQLFRQFLLLEAAAAAAARGDAHGNSFGSARGHRWRWGWAIHGARIASGATSTE